MILIVHSILIAKGQYIWTISLKKKTQKYANQMKDYFHRAFSCTYLIELKTSNSIQSIHICRTILKKLLEIVCVA